MSFDALLKLIPAYIADLLGLLAGPRRHFADRDLNGRDELKAALLFLLNSSFIAYALRVPFHGEEDSFWLSAMVTVLFYIPTAVALAFVAFGACRIVGGRGGLTGHVTLFAHVAGVSALTLALSQLIARGIAKTELAADQFALYLEYLRRMFSGAGGLDEARFESLVATDAMLVSMLVLGGGFLVTLIWIVWAWGAFADWNRIGGLRRTGALMLFFAGAYPVSVAFGYAQTAAGVAPF